MKFDEDKWNEVLKKAVIPLIAGILIGLLILIFFERIVGPLFI